MSATITLISQSGKRFQFAIYNPNVDWNNVPGLYAFIDSTGAISYIGQATSFRDRPLGVNHPRWKEAAQLGSKYIAAHPLNGPEASRISGEADLIAAYNPPLNTQGRIGLAPGFGFGLGAPRRRSTLLGGK